MPHPPVPTFPSDGHSARPYPDPATGLGQAWQTAWRLLSLRTDPMDGHVLAAGVAARHGLAPVTVLGLLTKAATAGLLEREHHAVAGSRGLRYRTHYKILRP